jgi:hypothetical protein
MTPYGWACQVCGASNEAASSSCAVCRFPAVASAYEIEQAKVAGISSTNPYVSPQRHAEAPAWKLVLVWSALISMLAGVFFVVAGGVRVMLLGISLVGAGAFVFWVMGGFKKGEPRA